jgi:hypothetical protein
LNGAQGQSAVSKGQPATWTYPCLPAGKLDEEGYHQSEAKASLFTYPLTPSLLTQGGGNLNSLFQVNNLSIF